MRVATALCGVITDALITLIVKFALYVWWLKMYMQLHEYSLV